MNYRLGCALPMLLVLIAAVAACGGVSATATVGSACAAVFRQAAEIDPAQDTVSDLDDAVRVCRNEDEWRAASAAFPKALDGAGPGVFLRNRCAYAPDLADTPLCKSVALVDLQQSP